jgi:4-hydroxy-4-methyl-2-oxoglutarate aldolase
LTAVPQFVLADELVERLRRVKVADLADGCRRLGFAGASAGTEMRPAVPYSRLIGVAMPVRCTIEPGSRSYDDQVAELYGRGLPPRRAVVVQQNDVPQFTSIGSGGARVARTHGYVGWITSGALRDTDELKDTDFPVYGTSIVPSGRTVSDVPEGQSFRFVFGEPVTIAGMVVAPGDLVVRDNDGLIAFPPGRAVPVLEQAEAILDEEATIFRLIDQGLTYRQILEARRMPDEGE